MNREQVDAIHRGSRLPTLEHFCFLLCAFSFSPHGTVVICFSRIQSVLRAATCLRSNNGIRRHAPEIWQERPNISALAREFAVARRTIIRDLKEMIRRGQLKPEVYPEWENETEE